MDPALTDFRPTLAWRARVALARVHRHLGTAGLVGIVALVAGLLMGWKAWERQQRFVQHLARRPAETAIAAPAPAPAPTPRVRWPSAGDVPLLLARMERAAVQEGLGWPQADYRVTAPTGEAPAALEVRSTLKGPYPAIRRFLTTLLLDQPTLTLREFGISRANAEAGNVEARLTLVVYLGGSPGVGRP